MSYLALSRKYRPSTFDEIVGQEHVTRTLKNALARGRIHHAYLFTGARGVGKTTAARALARALNCVNGPTATPCGVCASCREIAAGASPDLIEIDGASNNSVEDVRQIRDTVQYTPAHGKKKIYLVDEVHMLSKGAFNALLKTLEEPPPHVVFLFATTEANRIPETILSRVQRFDFKRIPQQAVVVRLRGLAEKEGVEISDAALRMVARAGEGSMRDAESLLDQVIAATEPPILDSAVAEALGLVDRALLHDFVAGLVHGRPEQSLQVIEHVYGFGYELSELTADSLELLRNATFVRLSEGARKHVDVSGDELQRLVALTDDADPERLGRLFSALLDVHDQVAKSDRPRVVLEMAVARLADVRPLVPVAGLVGRLEQLERSLRRGGGGGGGSAPRPGPMRAAPPPPKEIVTAAPPKEATPPKEVAPPPPRHEPSPPKEAAPPSAFEKAQAARASRPVAPPAKPEEPPPSENPAPETAPATPTGTPWERFLAASQAPASLRDVTLHVDGAALRLVLTGAKAVADARRFLSRPEVAQVLRAHFPDQTAIQVQEASSAPSTESDAATRSAEQDPALQRIVRTLDARIERVLPPTDASDGGFP